MNNHLYFVSGNKSKVQEAELLLGFPIRVADIDLDEIQGLDIEKIVEKKASDAFTAVKNPVIVDDVGFYVDAWNGFPGPLVKYLLESGGNQLLLKMLGDEINRKAFVVSAVGFHDGSTIKTFLGKVYGTITREPKATRDASDLEKIFIPDGQKKRYAEMTLSEKNLISHWKMSFDLLKEHLQKNNIHFS